MHSQVSTTRRQFILTILKQNQTPQEVVDWFGCGHEKKKKKRKNSFGYVNKRFGLLPVWGKTKKKKKAKTKTKKMYKRSSGKSPSYPGSCTIRVRILIAGIDRVQ